MWSVARRDEKDMETGAIRRQLYALQCYRDAIDRLGLVQVKALFHSALRILNEDRRSGIESNPPISLSDLNILKCDSIPAGRYLLPLIVSLVPGKLHGYCVTWFYL